MRKKGDKKKYDGEVYIGDPEPQAVMRCFLKPSDEALKMLFWEREGQWKTGRPGGE